MENLFSKNLKVLRENRKLSQNKLAKMIGVNQTTVARWEDDEMTPRLDMVLKLAEIFDVDLATLAGRKIVVQDGLISVEN